MEKLLDKLRQSNIKTVTSLSLAEHSSFRIGGCADAAVFPRSREQLIASLTLLREAGVPFTVIGNASNVVFADEGYRGAIVFTTALRNVCIEDTTVTAEAGAGFSALSVTAGNASLCGMEFAYGIPGTVGGAVFMNAGAFGGSMADICVRSEYFDTERGVCGFLEGDAQAFSYRTSAYEKNPSRVILGATLHLLRGEQTEIQTKMRELMERRRSTQPHGEPSAGSVFKRPEGYFAGKLIEDCGLKGTCIGGAEVSWKHAGFIVNRGGATSSDVRRLVELIQKTVLKETGVMLECEIRFL